MDRVRAIPTRFLCLVVVPTALAASAWIDIFSSVNWNTNAAHLILVCIPLLALPVVFTYLAITREWIRLLPLLPFIVVSVVFAVSMWQLAIDISREPDGAFIPLLQGGTGLLLPLLAFGGGIAGSILPASR